MKSTTVQTLGELRMRGTAKLMGWAISWWSPASIARGRASYSIRESIHALRCLHALRCYIVLVPSIYTEQAGPVELAYNRMRFFLSYKMADYALAV